MVQKKVCFLANRAIIAWKVSVEAKNSVIFLPKWRILVSGRDFVRFFKRDFYGATRVIHCKDQRETPRRNVFMPELPEVETLRHLLTHHLVSCAHPGRLLPLPGNSTRHIVSSVCVSSNRHDDCFGAATRQVFTACSGRWSRGTCRTDGATGDPFANARQSARRKAAGRA